VIAIDGAVPEFHEFHRPSFGRKESPHAVHYALQGGLEPEARAPQANRSRGSGHAVRLSRYNARGRLETLDFCVLQWRSLSSGSRHQSWHGQASELDKSPPDVAAVWMERKAAPVYGQVVNAVDKISGAMRSVIEIIASVAIVLGLVALVVWIMSQGK
jgi:hypothetical protein